MLRSTRVLHLTNGFASGQDSNLKAHSVAVFIQAAFAHTGTYCLILLPANQFPPPDYLF